MPTYPLIGAHLSTSKGLVAMVQTAEEIGAACIQMFTTSPQQWRDKRYAEEDVAAFRAALAVTGVGPVASHESYLINLASGDPVLLEKSREAFRQEIVRCGVLGLPMVIIHWGSFKGATLEEGLGRLVESLNQLIPLADAAGVQIVLETTAGQGSYLGGEFTQFARLFEMVAGQERLGVCLDTCHVFAAGYDIRTEETYAKTMDALKAALPLARLRFFHINDSVTGFNSHVDRHAHLGDGQLGLEPFRLILNDARFAKIGKCLETESDEKRVNDLKILRGLVHVPNEK
jgi:deoxyribonuclease-4